MRFILCTLTALSILIPSLANSQESKYYAVPKGDFPHDVAVGPGGEVWYSGQKRGVAGRLDPVSGQIERIPLGGNSAPHGVIVGPDGAPWFTDGAERHRARGCRDERNHGLAAPSRAPLRQSQYRCL
jgi:streptogramin lyase